MPAVGVLHRIDWRESDSSPRGECFHPNVDESRPGRQGCLRRVATADM